MTMEYPREALHADVDALRFERMEHMQTISTLRAQLAESEAALNLETKFKNGWVTSRNDIAKQCRTLEQTIERLRGKVREYSESKSLNAQEAMFREAGIQASQTGEN